MTYAEAREVLLNRRYLANLTKPNLPSTKEFSDAVDLAVAAMEIANVFAEPTKWHERKENAKDIL